MSDETDLVVVREGGLAPLKELRRTLENVGVPAVILEPIGGCRGG